MALSEYKTDGPGQFTIVTKNAIKWINFWKRWKMLNDPKELQKYIKKRYDKILRTN